MKLGLRGIMDAGGDIHSWPMLAMDHADFFAKLPSLQKGMRARWRQWDVDAKVDFDPGATSEDRANVEAYVRSINRWREP